MWKSICQATTIKGRRCRKKRVGDKFCTIHNPDYKKPEQDICSICVDEIIEKTVIYECGHNFCKTCIYTWLCKCLLDFNCPLCRTVITDIKFRSDAWRYGVLNKLLYLVKIFTINVSNITIIEYDLIKPIIMYYENTLLPTATMQTVYDQLIENGFNKIYDKLIEKTEETTRLDPLKDDLSEPERVYFIIKNEN
jgi:hypothetical protein